jgi:hypothetical protein
VLDHGEVSSCTFDVPVDHQLLMETVVGSADLSVTAIAVTEMGVTFETPYSN